MQSKKLAVIASINILRLREDGRHFADDVFKCISLNGGIWISINISWKFVPKGQINNIPTLVQITAWHRPGNKPLSEPTMVSSVTRTHWGRVTHICVGNLTIIGSDNGLSPGRHQAIIRTIAGILLIRTLGTNFSEIWNEIHSFSSKKMHLKMLYGKRRPFCLGLNVLMVWCLMWPNHN